MLAKNPEGAWQISRSLYRASALLAVCASAQTRRLLPVDESGRDPKLVAYLTKFKAAVVHRNREKS